MDQKNVTQSNPAIERAGAALRWFDTMRRESEWGLTPDEQSRILGMNRNDFDKSVGKAINREPVSLSEEELTRIGLLLSIYKELKRLEPITEENISLNWFNSPNNGSLFQGCSPKELLLKNGSINTMIEINGYLKQS